MSANKKIGRIFTDSRFDSDIIMARRSSYMGQPNLYLFSFKDQMFLIYCPYKGIVYIPIHGLKWLESSKSISRLNIANITCMPDFITCSKMIKKPWMNPTV